MLMGTSIKEELNEIRTKMLDSLVIEEDKKVMDYINGNNMTPNGELLTKIASSIQQKNENTIQDAFDAIFRNYSPRPENLVVIDTLPKDRPGTGKIHAASLYGTFGGSCCQYGLRSPFVVFDEDSMLDSWYPSNHILNNIEIPKVGDLLSSRQNGKRSGYIGGDNLCMEDIWPKICPKIISDEYDPFISGQRLVLTKVPEFCADLFGPVTRREKYKLYPFPGRDGKCAINQRIRLRKSTEDLRKQSRINPLTK
jgi:hypothetical protein